MVPKERSENSGSWGQLPRCSGLWQLWHQEAAAWGERRFLLENHDGEPLRGLPAARGRVGELESTANPPAASAFVLVKHHLKSSGFVRECSSGRHSCHLQREAQMSKHPPTFPLRLLDCNGSRVVPEHITPK